MGAPPSLRACWGRIGRGLRLPEIRHERQFLRLQDPFRFFQASCPSGGGNKRASSGIFFSGLYPLPTMTPKAKIHPMAMIVMIPLVMRPEKLKLIVYFRLDNFFSPPASPPPDERDEERLENGIRDMFYPAV
ncbi:MAG: hypothetical protein ACLR7Z_15135 [Bilophila wadsworthia]